MKLLLLGFDALDYKALFEDKFAGEDFAKELREGAAVTLVPPRPLTGPSWTSIMTGTSMDVHGVQDGWCRKVHGWKTYDEVEVPYIWDLFNAKGLSCGVVNIPCTYPARMVTEFMISGFPAPRLSTFPKSLAAELRRYRVDFLEEVPHDLKAQTVEYLHFPIGKAIRIMKAVAYQRLLLALGLAHKYGVDCLFIQFSFLDRLLHMVRLFKKQGLDYDRQFRQTHSWVKEIVHTAVDGARPEVVVIVSDHGSAYHPGERGYFGGHSKRGVFVGQGGYFRDGGTTRQGLIVPEDVVPLVFAAMDLALPKEATDISGCAYPKMLAPGVRKGDKQIIEARLKGLGYLSD